MGFALATDCKATATVPQVEVSAVPAHSGHPANLKGMLSRNASGHC